MDFAVDTIQGYVFFEIQGEAEPGINQRALGSTSSAFGNQQFPGRQSSDAQPVPRANWSRHAKPVYLIQFLSYRPWNDPSHGCSSTHFCLRDEYAGEKIDGLHVIQIGLGRPGPDFWVADEIASGWTPFEWWCFFLEFSHRFTPADIARCVRLGMPREVVAAFGKVQQKSWSTLTQRHYTVEVVTVDIDVQDLEYGSSSAGRKAFLKELMKAFLAYRLPTDLALISSFGRLPLDVVRSVWDGLSNANKTEALFDDFVSFLSGNQLILEETPEAPA
jgi:hypothetical protein